MGPPAVDLPDLPDPFGDTPGDTIPGDSDDLISQLAGDDLDRLMGGRPLPRVNPVQELTSQLDTFFEELRERQATITALARQEQAGG